VRRLYVGSGATLQNLADLKRYATGVIVGSALRRGGKAGAPLDPKALKAFAKVFRQKAAKSISGDASPATSLGTSKKTPKKTSSKKTRKKRRK